MKLLRHIIDNFVINTDSRDIYKVGYDDLNVREYYAKLETFLQTLHESMMLQAQQLAVSTTLSLRDPVPLLSFPKNYKEQVRDIYNAKWFNRGSLQVDLVGLCLFVIYMYTTVDILLPDLLCISSKDMFH